MNKLYGLQIVRHEIIYKGTVNLSRTYTCARIHAQYPRMDLINSTENLLRGKNKMRSLKKCMNVCR